MRPLTFNDAYNWAHKPLQLDESNQPYRIKVDDTTIHEKVEGSNDVFILKKQSEETWKVIGIQ